MGCASRGTDPQDSCSHSPVVVRVDPGGAGVLMGEGCRSSKSVNPYFGGFLFILAFLPSFCISPITLGVVLPHFFASPVNENPKSCGFPGARDTRISCAPGDPSGTWWPVLEVERVEAGRCSKEGEKCSFSRRLDI